MSTAQQERAQFGVAGMGVMGQSLALNVADHGFRTAVWDRHPERFDELRQKGAPAHLKGHATLKEFVSALERPRRILLMVTAGAGAAESTGHRRQPAPRSPRLGGWASALPRARRPPVCRKPGRL